MANSQVTPRVPQCEEEEHEFEVISDWYGDPNVINGTKTFTFLRCSICGQERSCQEGDL